MADDEARVDPVLLEQLEGAATTGALVECVVFLRQPAASSEALGEAGPADLLSPGQVEGLAHDVVARAEASSGSRPQVVNVFRNLGSFVVSAAPSFVRALIDQPEVSSVVANRQPDDR